MTELSKRDEIVRKAIEVFGVNGFRATSMREVAQHVGLSKPALYHYFTSKEELLVEIYKSVIAENISAAQRITEHTNRPVAALRQMLFERVVYTCQNSSILQIFHEEENELPAHLMEEVQASRRDYQRLMTELLRQAQKEGELDFEGSPSVVANCFLGACNWSYKWYRPGGAQKPEQLAEQLVNVLLMGVLAPKARRSFRRLAS